MSDSEDNNTTSPAKKTRNLKDAIYVVKNRQVERDDVVVDMKAAEEARLVLLADELRPLVKDIDPDDDRFELAMAMGDRPRLWIDMTSFVSMGHDRRTYRFLKDTRMGRIVLGEHLQMEDMADSVSNYIAERVLERERAIEGEWMSLKEEAKLDDAAAKTDAAAPEVVPDIPATKTKRGGFWRGLFTFLFGVAVTLLILGAAVFYLVPDAF